MVNLKSIRDYAAANKKGTAFAAAMAVESDVISEADYSAKLRIWFALLKMEEDSS